MFQRFMHLSLYWFVILLKCIKETASMKAQSAPLQFCNCSEQHMDKCVFIIFRPWSLIVMVVTNTVKPETI